MLNGTCDKCGEVVPMENSVHMLEIEMAPERKAYLDRYRHDRHLFPTDKCEGSPSRAQYCGAGNDPRGIHAYPKNDEFAKQIVPAWERYRATISAAFVGAFGSNPDRLPTGSHPSHATYQDNEYEIRDGKVYRRTDGMVAVLYSPGYGSGWSSGFCDTDEERARKVFCPAMVMTLLNVGQSNGLDMIKKIADEQFPDAYKGGLDELEIEWLKPGTRFEIHEYDGAESVRIINMDDFLTA